MLPLILTLWVVAGDATAGALDGTPPWAGVAGIASGWGIVGILVLMLFRGDIGTRREMNSYERTIESLRETNATLMETNAAFTSEFSTSNAMIQAVLDVAKDRRAS